MNQRPADRTETISAFYVMAILERAKELEQQGRDVIHMEIGEPDFLTPRTITDASIAYLEAGNVKYTPAAGLSKLRTSIAKFYCDRYGVAVDEGRIFITPGASGAFLLALGASLNAGEKVLMADPCYPCNSNFVKFLGGRAQTIPVDAGSDFQLNSALIEKYWSSDCKGAVIASPSNPTGTVIAPDVLRQAIETVRERNGVFYSDEIYHGLVYDGNDAVSALQYSADVFVINSFSKYFGMTGWRVGWLIVPEAYAEVVEKLAQNIFIATASHSQYAALAAFDTATIEELEKRRLEFQKRRDFLYGQLHDLGFKLPAKPDGAFYIYADCSRFTDDSYRFALDLLEAEGVAVTPGKDFGVNQAERFIRFAYTTSIERMGEAMARLARFIGVRGKD
ncbi:aminotransferase class I/II-fold pyridoxal phosphate-dependent enzyme [Methylotuvimicrobium buryatense]|uniref:Aminotransferase n=2 Tax=Methylotuvimicrobium buryatense TaxID=95641 RepID=A0A4P9UY19_METBY|nr:aminotransferase class I/II-fold pyridoxal phosphate-dependent enzyme [Methylotuvimicrobium buryatense]QCW84756.1 aminotransferase class I/II-fold pyridoxal phosphate-dependent enzyme [Methylotuvimicrobium buryatense]